MTALVAEALALAERHHITIALVGGDRLSWESRGPTPGRALKALRAAKAELIDLLVRYQLDSSGALAGDDLLAELRAAGFAVRRYGVLPASTTTRGPLDRVPATPLLYAFANKRAEYSCALRALGRRTASQACARRTRQPNRKQPKHRRRREGARSHRSSPRYRLPGLPRPGRASYQRHHRPAARSVQTYLAGARLRDPQRRPRRRSGAARSKGGDEHDQKSDFRLTPRSRPERRRSSCRAFGQGFLSDDVNPAEVAERLADAERLARESCPL